MTHESVGESTQDASLPHTPTAAFHVVGIGASAGGLDAIERLFDQMPVDTGLAFVIVQHLSPDYDSLMDELLARHTSMNIYEVEDAMEVEPNGIYLIPPRKNMVLSQGQLLLTDQDKNGSLNLPIDIFFRSLAQDAGDRSIAVVLSGTGSDGSRGIQDIHDAGGLVVVQDLDSAGFDGMPRSALATRLADVVCPPELMAEQIAKYVSKPAEFSPYHSHPLDQFEGDDDRVQIFRLFRQEFGVDFSLYKPATIERRIERRLQIAHAANLSEYVELLSSDREELDALYRDLLVEVTQFFRDTDAYDQIRSEVVPKLVDNAPERAELRVWVPGCATGEEAYSLAMLFYDYICRKNANRTVKVFATDVHDRSLENASAGVYPAAAISNVPDELRSKYFTNNGDLYHVSRELRQLVIFAHNDITRDPPFTNIDLISCRNVLIYLDPQVQKRVLTLFHFGMKANGVLFLGPSETLGDLANEFETIDRHWRIYQKQRDVRLPVASKLPASPKLSQVVHGRAPFVARNPRSYNEKLMLGAFESLLSEYVPPSLLVNEFHELVHTFGDARRLLEVPAGKPTTEVLKLVPNELRMALSSALHKASQEDRPVTYSGLRVSKPDVEGLYRLRVEPYRRGPDRLSLIIFERKEIPSAATSPAPEEFDAGEGSHERITVLEQELSYTRETLQSTVEELETSNEELQCTNEELVASNEELQSTNEELHSVNEELYTVNAEHQQKIEELIQLTSDMDNLLKSTQIGVVFLDRQLRIRMFTPAISDTFNMIDQDVGRPIDHIAHKLDHPNLLDEVNRVLETGQNFECEIPSRDGKTIYLERIRPYRDVHNEIGGVALTLTDISAVKQVELALEQNRELMRINNDMQEFAYAVSHDLQAPLRHVKMLTSELLSQYDDLEVDEQTSRLTKMLHLASDRLTTMMQGLLSYSRVNTRGKDFRKVDIQALFEEVVTDLTPEINRTGATITFSDLPTVNGDDAQLERALTYLLDNAVKYGGEDPPVVSLSATKDRDHCHFCMTDNGVGIESRHLERIFIVFQRLGFKPEVEGEGLGLALCKRIIERHGGHIWCESTPGEGSQFHFTLPNEPNRRD